MPGTEYSQVRQASDGPLPEAISTWQSISPVAEVYKHSITKYHRWDVVLSLLGMALSKVCLLATPGVHSCLQIFRAAYHAFLQASGILSPLALGLAVDSISSGRPFISLIVVWAAAAVGYILFREVQRLALVRVQVTTYAATATEVMSHIMELGLSFQLGSKVSSTQRCVQRGLESINRAVDSIALRLVPALLEITCILAVLTFRFNSMWVALSSLVGVAVYVRSTAYLSQVQRGKRKTQNKSDGDTYARFTDSLQNMALVAAYSAEDTQIQRYSSGVQTYLAALWDAKLFTTKVTLAQTAMTRGTQLAGYLLAAHQLSSGAVTVGDFLAMTALIGNVFAPISWLPTLVMELSNQVTDVAALCALLREEAVVQDTSDLLPLPCMQSTAGGWSAELRFEDVSFAYPGGGERGAAVAVLRGVSFAVQAGSTTAIVGSTGSGKSTILSLLLRHWEVSTGRILVGGADISEHNVQSLRRGTALVSQSAVMLDLSIKDNIMLGRPGASEAELAEAVAAAQLSGTVQRLPQGLGTKAGSGGGQLSGGERQRVSLARAFLRRPRLLLLDEPTSALDASTDAAVMHAVREVQATLGCTCVVVAHRLSSIAYADQVVVLEGGSIVQAGPPAQLQLDAGGRYAQLLQAQAAEPQATK